MRSIFFLLLLAACSGCGQHDKPAPNKWSDDRLWPVLDAQDRRATTELCAYLNDSSAIIREAAALAFASVQDSTSIPCMLKVLGDAEPSVRAAVVFALGFVADSVTVVRMAQHALNERDNTVHRAYLSASFIAMQRNGMLKDPQAILHYLQHATSHGRVRAADALRRLPDSLVQKAESEIDDLMAKEGTEVRQFLILAKKKFAGWVSRRSMQIMAEEQTSPGERVNALRVCGALEGMSEDEFFFDRLGDPVTGAVALEIVSARPSLDAHECLRRVTQETDTAMRIALLGMAKKHGDAEVRRTCDEQLQRLAMQDLGAYLSAALIRVQGIYTPQPWIYPITDSAFNKIRRSAFNAPSAIERTAALETTISWLDSAAAHVAPMNGIMCVSCIYDVQCMDSILTEALRSKDMGLIAIAANRLVRGEQQLLKAVLNNATVQDARSSLHLPRDTEALEALEKAIAKQDGLPAPSHHRPAFNHPIDKRKLQALKQGQRYRINTTKGEIIIATDVNDCPGSSLAFDSLVTAGYYNGKAFHRMVPNFVVQGGCPRGDGYGGMPWTLRTEIGRTPFTAGSVGLASAGRDTESCQFFITHSNTPHLDGRYTRFGEVVSGMDVVWMLQVGDVMDRVERITH